MGRPVKYLDSCIIIYLVEGALSLRSEVAAWLVQQVGTDGLFVTSQLSRLECRVKPLREGARELLERYDMFFSRSDLRLMSLSAAVIERATLLRVRYNFKTPDALHLATALEMGVSTFLTSDKELARLTDLFVEVFPSS